MLRQSYKSDNINKIVGEISEWLEAKVDDSIIDSFNYRNETDTRVKTSIGNVCTRIRYFERYQQRHATITQERTELPMSEVLEQWIKNVKTYPPAEIFFQKTGPKFEKAEKRCKTICEDLYRFSFPEGEVNVLNELGAAYREFEVLTTLGYDDLKEGRLRAVSTKFLECAKSACAALEVMHKKDQLLGEYYKSWKVKYQDISTEVHKLTKEFI